MFPINFLFPLNRIMVSDAKLNERYGKKSYGMMLQTCSTDILCISWIALSILSLVPCIVIMSDCSDMTGTEILVDVCFSRSRSLCPDFPRITLWWALGIDMVLLAYLIHRKKSTFNKFIKSSERHYQGNQKIT